MDKLGQLIGSIRGIEVPLEGDRLTLGRLADQLDLLRMYLADALEELRQSPPNSHGGDRHNQVIYCSCEKCI